MITEPVETIRDSVNLSKFPRPVALIAIVHKYGYDPNRYSPSIRYIFNAVICNCYWSGMFGETGQNCARCYKKHSCEKSQISA